MPHVLLATCSDLPAGDEDGDALVAALARLEVDASWQVWNDPAAKWDEDLVVVRSTWDYTSDRMAFLDWAHSVARLENAASVIEWTSDKSYLRELAGVDVPVVPTTWLEPGAEIVLPTSGEFVVKPSVGAGSRGAGRFAPDSTDAARDHIRLLHEAGRTVMLQPYLTGVDTVGETALIYLDGVFSHAVGKAALLAPAAVNPLELRHDELYVGEQMTAREASPAELAVGARVITAVRRILGGEQLYARVDLLPGADGPVLVELELAEPSLFLGYAPGAVERFAAVIAARA
jgi:glutathione synthase/RimK-type ligase-like ATP-grasp enzyme